jgi:hypothetical protein
MECRGVADHVGARGDGCEDISVDHAGRWAMLGVLAPSLWPGDAQALAHGRAITAADQRQAPDRCTRLLASAAGASMWDSELHRRPCKTHFSANRLTRGLAMPAAEGQYWRAPQS